MNKKDLIDSLNEIYTKLDNLEDEYDILSRQLRNFKDDLATQIQTLEDGPLTEDEKED